jgi:hypothetical protein
MAKEEEEGGGEGEKGLGDEREERGKPKECGQNGQLQGSTDFWVFP